MNTQVQIYTQAEEAGARRVPFSWQLLFRFLIEKRASFIQGTFLIQVPKQEKGYKKGKKLSQTCLHLGADVRSVASAQFTMYNLHIFLTQRWHL